MIKGFESVGVEVKEEKKTYDVCVCVKMEKELFLRLVFQYKPHVLERRRRFDVFVVYCPWLKKEEAFSIACLREGEWERTGGRERGRIVSKSILGPTVCRGIQGALDSLPLRWCRECQCD